MLDRVFDYAPKLSLKILVLLRVQVFVWKLDTVFYSNQNMILQWQMLIQCKKPEVYLGTHI